MSQKLLASLIFFDTTQVAQGYEPDTLSQIINSRVSVSLKAAGLVTSPRADYPELPRRTYRDVLGRIPSSGEMVARDGLVGQLVKSHYTAAVARTA
jgi:hypothetical protein